VRKERKRIRNGVQERRGEFDKSSESEEDDDEEKMM
jgi:hypothetical protein